MAEGQEVHWEGRFGEVGQHLLVEVLAERLGVQGALEVELGLGALVLVAEDQEEPLGEVRLQGERGVAWQGQEVVASLLFPQIPC